MEPQASRASAAEIDASCRWPVGFLLTKSLGWLLVASCLSVLSSIKLHAPGFLANCSWLTYGRVQPAAWNCFVFGFASQAALGVALWLSARLTGTLLVGARTICVGTVLWNLGITVGLLGILAGDGTGIESLELPAYASPILFAGYLAIASWSIVTGYQRRGEPLFVSQWYLMAAIFAFPWVFSAGHLMGVFFPLRGILQAAVQVWYWQNLFTLWLSFIGLAILFYLLPKLTGVAVPSRPLAVFGLWTMALFGSFGGMYRYLGGPIPAYMVSTGVVGTVLTIVPLLAVAMNLWPVYRSRVQSEESVNVVRFVGFALVSYLVHGLLTVLSSLQAFGRITHFTLLTVAMDQLFLQGFVGMALLGATLYVLPRLFEINWPSLGFTRFYFRCVGGGIALGVIALAAGGIVQGLAMENATIPFFDVVRRYVPFAGTSTLANLVIAFGNFVLCAAVSLQVLLWLAERYVPSVWAWFQPSPVVREAKA